MPVLHGVNSEQGMGIWVVMGPKIRVYESAMNVEYLAWRDE